MQNNKVCFFGFILLFIYPISLYGNEEISFSIAPQLSLPMGVVNDMDVFNKGGFGFRLSGDYKGLSPLHFLGRIEYQTAASSNDTNLHLLALQAGGGFRWALSPAVDFVPNAYGGGFLGYTYPDDGAALSLVFGMEGILHIDINKIFKIGMGLSFSDFRNYDNQAENKFGLSLYRSISVSLSASFYPRPPAHQPRLRLLGIFIPPFFPVLSSYYSSNPPGVIFLRNEEAGEINNLKVVIHTGQYTEAPAESAMIESMAPGEELDISMPLFFSKDLLNVKTDINIPAQIQISYTYEKEKIVVEITTMLYVFERNAVTWEEDMISSFVTYKDENIRRLSKAIIHAVKEENLNKIDKNFLRSMALFNGMLKYGMSYVNDPQGRTVERDGREWSLDYLQFPVETLNLRAGDCEDLAVLYTSMIESVGIPSAFITTPGHIYAALALDQSPSRVKEIFRYPENFIFKEGKAWIPVETTLVEGDFLKAWQVAARDWSLNSNKSTTRFITTASARKIFKEPADVSGSFPAVRIPQPGSLASGYTEHYNRFIHEELGEQAARLRQVPEYIAGDPAAYNRLGVLYARYGMIGKALAEFKKIPDEAEYLPALLNLIYLFYLDNDIEKALYYCYRANTVSPQNSRVGLYIKMLEKSYNQFEAVFNSYKELLDFLPPGEEEVPPGEDGTKAFSGIKFNDPLWWILE